MKKSLHLLTALGFFALTACSSLDVNEAEAIEGNYPDDFSAAEYMALHPELRSLQIRDYVKNYNKALELSSDAIDADVEAFSADSAALYRIFITPEYAGYSEEFWLEIEGQISTAQLTFLKQFNFYDTLDDLTALTKIPVDTLAISFQYLVFGREHGWAYRKCSDAEKKNPIQAETYPAVKLYCDDDGIIREIAE
ncbi:hypothetical protein [uncultured Fibrobacter sp.]|uniref:hypothetical protein n=1 Tax=uncultured Fibrobacter sp. TaxID=261512 RepID=UPI002597BF53|nr:hypothetical protein [uncultured Fibrobacter sp.]